VKYLFLLILMSGCTTTLQLADAEEMDARWERESIEHDMLLRDIEIQIRELRADGVIK
jgi:hypothetical protein